MRTWIMRNLILDESGSTTVEQALIIACVVATSVAAWGAMAESTGRLVGTVTQTVSGDPTGGTSATGTGITYP